MSERAIRIRWAALGVGAFVLLMGVEVLTEDEAIDLADLAGDALQTAPIVASATGVALLTGRFQDEREEKETLMRDLQMARAEGAAWRERAQGYLSGLGVEIEKQFEQWQLTAAEREVGLLMLKGVSHREIAGLRGTTEATVRHPGPCRLPEVQPAWPQRLLRLLPRGPAPRPRDERGHAGPGLTPGQALSTASRPPCRRGTPPSRWRRALAGPGFRDHGAASYSAPS